MARTLVEEPGVGDYICVYLEHGWVQIKRESEGIVVDVFNSDDRVIHTAAIENSDLDAGVPE